MESQQPDMERSARQERLNNLSNKASTSYPSSTRYSESAKTTVRIKENSTAAHWVCMVGGTILMLIGLAGFVGPNLFGMHLTWAHNFVHIIAGAAALFYGMNSTVSSVKNFCYVLGGIFGVLGIAGFIFGTNTNLIPPTMSYDSFWWPISAGNLQFGTADHVMHLLYAVVFIVGAVLTSSKFKEVPPSVRGSTWH